MGALPEGRLALSRRASLAAGVIAAAPALFLAWQYLSVYQAPLAGVNRHLAAYAWLVIPLEFLLVHSGAFAAGVATVKDGAVCGMMMAFLSLVYLGLIGSIIGVSDAPFALVGAVTLLILGRLVAGAMRAGGGDTSGIALAFFMVMAWLVLFVYVTSKSAVPWGGFTPEVLAELNPRKTTGFMAPQRAVFFCCVWFFFIGAVELLRALRSGQAERAEAEEAAAADLTLDSPRLRFSFARGEVELRDSGSGSVALPLVMMAGVPCTMGVAGLTGGAPILGVLLLAVGAFFACMVAMKAGRVLVLRARKDELEVVEYFPSAEKRRLRFQAPLAERLELRAIADKHGNDTQNRELVVSLGEGTPIMVAFGLPKAQGEALRRLLLAYVEHGADAAQALREDRQLFHFLGNPARVLVETPRRETLPPVYPGDMLPVRQVRPGAPPPPEPDPVPIPDRRNYRE